MYSFQKTKSESLRPGSGGKTTQSSGAAGLAAAGAAATSGALANGAPKRTRRKVIPEKPNYSVNLWSIMKNCVGRDLSKIPMPVRLSACFCMLA